MITAYLIDEYHHGMGWRYSETMFLTISILALLSNLALWYYDYKYQDSMLQNKDHNGRNVDSFA